jgi:3',5'-cyclic AMP phosphodiesterase CpdA
MRVGPGHLRLDGRMNGAYHPEDPMRIMHLSDLHLQAPWRVRDYLRRGPRLDYLRLEFVLQGRRERYLAAEAKVVELLCHAEEAKVDHVIVSGDLSALGLPQEFEMAREVLASFAGRLTLVPGNHDAYHRDGLGSFERALADLNRPSIGQFVREGPYPLVQLLGEEVAIIGLCSARWSPVPGLARGAVGPAQLMGLRAALADERLERRALIVVVHHAPFRADGSPDRWHHGLSDFQPLLETLGQSSVIALCHGHLHGRYRTDGKARFPIFGAGSSTEEGHEGSWIYELGSGGSLLQALSFNGGSAAHREAPPQAEALANPPAPSGTPS